MIEDTNITMVEDYELAELLYIQWLGFPNIELYRLPPINSYGDPAHRFTPDGHEQCSVIKDEDKAIGVVYFSESGGGSDLWFIINPEIDTVSCGIKCVDAFCEQGFPWNTEILLHQDDHPRINILASCHHNFEEKVSEYEGFRRFFWSIDFEDLPS